MATIKDIAARAGVTATTVSRVINNRGYISEETRKKVTQAMQEMNYQPNELARSLAKAHSNTIGVIVLFTEEVGGILDMEFDEEGNLLFKSTADEEDLLYDDIACGLLVKKNQYEKRDLLESLEMFYKVFFLGLDE